MLFLCKTGFFLVALIKSTWCMKISVEQEIKVVASNIIPRFEKLCHNQEGAQISLMSNCGHLKLKYKCFLSIYMYVFFSNVGCHFDINLCYIA